MGRWEPDAAERLLRAAMELFVERGFETTTVADIADRAGLTERTFFRHFADKREVLFYGQDRFEAALAAGLRAAPAAATPMEAVGGALAAAAALFPPERWPYARARQQAIDGTAALGERELGKLARCSAILADGLRARGVSEPTATLTAELGIVALRAGFARWTSGDGKRLLGDLLGEALRDVRVAAKS